METLIKIYGKILYCSGTYNLAYERDVIRWCYIKQLKQAVALKGEKIK